MNGGGADAALAMTCPGKRRFQAALIFLSVAQLIAGTVADASLTYTFTTLDNVNILLVALF